MTTIIRSTARIEEARHHPVTTALLVVVSWVVASTLVAAAHMRVEELSAPGGAMAVIASIVAVSYLYMRLCAPQATMSHALGVGIAWLLMAIGTEIAFATRLNHPWYEILGSPAHPLLRTVFLFVWIFSPALFVRTHDTEGQTGA